VAGCALTYALFIVGSGALMRRVGAMRFMGLAMSGASLAMVLHFMLVHPLASLVQPAPVYVHGVVLALVCTVAPSLLMGEGLKRVGAQRFAIISSLGPVGTVLLAWLVLGEAPTVVALAGMVLTIGAGVAMGLAKPKA
jgi:drug/metabolite transporter (DMT)-like permease